MLRTRITKLFGIEYPIMSAPMSGHASADLAVAVSEAGGLGSFGAIDERGPDWVREQIRAIRSRSERPFCVGFITPFIQFLPDCFEVTIEERVPAIALSFADPQPWLGRAKEAGARTLCQVQSMKGATQAVEGGADVIVAQGTEAGGHTGSMTLLPLLTRIAERYPETPLMAAGGIATGRALAAVLSAGADGAWVGTAFLATHEATDVPDVYKQRILESDGEDTMFTRVYDLVDGLPWPEEIGARVYANRFAREWHGRDAEIVERREELRRETSEAYQRDVEAAAVYMGQSAGDVIAIRPAAEVLRDICDSAERILAAR
ncbi:MAG: nitronate monooxygenase [Dehalococcoidia bacterium]